MDDVVQKGAVPTLSAQDEIALRLGLDHRKTRYGAGRLAAACAVIGMVVIGLVLIKPRPTVQYRTQAAQISSLSVFVNATGTLAPRDQVDVGAEVSGRIDRVQVDFNDRVRKGQVLAQINTDQLRTQLRQANAGLRQAQATADQARLGLTRARRLGADQAISQQALEGAVADVARGDASVALARAQVDQLQTQLAKTTIRSPIDGVVLDRKIEPGQTVVASLQAPVLFTLASDLTQLELDVDIDEADVGAVRTGQTATFAVDAYPGQPFSAKLVSVHSSPKTVNGVVTYQGVLWVDNPDGRLKPGMTATADIAAARLEEGLLIPNAGLRFTPAAGAPGADKAMTPAPGHAVVWIQKGGSVEPRDIRTGLTDGRLTQVLEGQLVSGEDVIVGIGASSSLPAAARQPASVLHDALRPGNGKGPGSRRGGG